MNNMDDKSYRVAMMQYYDEVLAQSARNYAFTSEKKWEQRYREVEPLSDKLLKETIEHSDSVTKDFFSKMDEANQQLVKMEYDAINLVNNNNSKQAIRLLDGKEYQQQREILAVGLEKFIHEHHAKESSSVVTRPVKEIIELERRLALLERQHEDEQFTILGHFAANMAHDLRNPLNVIKVSLDNIQLKYSHLPDTKSNFLRIDNSIDRIVHQVDNVLEFVQSSKLEKENTSLNDIISESVSSLKIPKGITINKPKQDVTLYCDYVKIGILFKNLLYNAIQACDDEGVIEIKTKNNFDSVLISIVDSGLGISETNMNKIFEPLFTTKQKGTGLGLASCKTIVDNHGGSILVHNNPTTFEITLPKPTKV